MDGSDKRLKLEVGMTMNLLRRMIRRGATKNEIYGVWTFLGELLFEPDPDLRNWKSHTVTCQKKYGRYTEMYTKEGGKRIW